MEQLRDEEGTRAERQLMALVAERLGISTVGVRSRSRLAEDLGASDVDLADLLLEVEETYGINISDAEAARIKTVADLGAMLAQKR